MHYRFSDFATDDLHEASHHYGRISPRLLLAFIEEVARALKLLVSNPYLGEAIGDRYRHLPLQRYPYMLIYTVDSVDQMISIVSVFHQRQEPDKWRDRVQEEPATYALAA
jgi:plasmid stabilization system protein ParE